MEMNVCDILKLNVEICLPICLIDCFPPLATQFDLYTLHPSLPESMKNFAPFSA